MLPYNNLLPILRYKTSDGPPLPTVILNIKCEEQIRGNKYKLRGSLEKDTTGVYKLDPDYRDKMKPKSEAGNAVYPKNDLDLKPYFNHWIAGKDHSDYKNQNKFNNRFLLYGRPQLGKTGVFLQLGYLLWAEVNTNILSKIQKKGLLGIIFLDK